VVPICVSINVNPVQGRTKRTCVRPSCLIYRRASCVSRWFLGTRKCQKWEREGVEEEPAKSSELYCHRPSCSAAVDVGNLRTEFPVRSLSRNSEPRTFPTVVWCDFPISLTTICRAADIVSDYGSYHEGWALEKRQVSTRSAEVWNLAWLRAPEEPWQRGSPAIHRIGQIKEMSPRCPGCSTPSPKLLLLYRSVPGLIFRIRLSKVRRHYR
jgi:hypothetical protein